MTRVAIFGTATLIMAICLAATFYHPVGIPMVIDAAVNRGRTMSVNGVFGNIGVSVAAGITATITAAIGWRFAFFVPAVVFVATGIAYLMYVPDDKGRRKPQLTANDVVLDRNMIIGVVVLFMTLALLSGLVFNSLIITLPKIVDARIGHDVPLAVVGLLATGIFLCGAAAQLSVGRLVERIQPHLLIAVIAICQLIGIFWVNYAVGSQLLLALAVAIAAIYAQVTINDIVLARYTPPAWRGRVYALRFFLIFTSAGPAVWMIGWLYDRGGFALVLWITAMIATTFVANSVAITLLVFGAEARRTRAAAQPAE